MRGVEELLEPKGVVDEGAETDAVADDLDRGDFGFPDDDGEDDEEDVLEDAGQGCYQA